MWGKNFNFVLVLKKVSIWIVYFWGKFDLFWNVGNSIIWCIYFNKLFYVSKLNVRFVLNNNSEYIIVFIMYIVISYFSVISVLFIFVKVGLEIIKLFVIVLNVIEF